MNQDQFQSQLEEIIVVVVGHFNPATFHPLWLSAANLIRTEEAKAADLDIIHKDIASFSTEWFNLQVLEGKLTISCSDTTKYLPLRDLVVGIFKTLEHTPIRAFGLNSNAHYLAPTEEHWHSFGDYYAPKQTWNQVVEKPGLRSLTIQGTREKSRAKMINLKVEPSNKVKPGIFYSINQHYETTDEEDIQASVADFLNTLDQEWEDFLHFRNSSAIKLLTDYQR